ncbi:MAG: purine-nucleoside phosphorylase [Anaerolineaceae bacterium]|nr:purine-nucleoside phosphorylase [Anaerolineaceae bacterium]
MEKTYSLNEIDRFAELVKLRAGRQPRIGMILGSGLGELAESIQDRVVIPYTELPDWPISTVEGHQGKMVIGTLEGQDVLGLQGRVHYYEGYSMSQVTLSVRVMQRLGIEILVVTNAAGAINPTFEPGDLMLITDQMSPFTMAGGNPLRGANLDEIGARFPDMSQAYDRVLMDLASKAAGEAGVNLREGVYVYLSGPSYETPAELRFLRLAGADAVGMSTVPEVIIARHGQMRVLGFSGVTNKANLDGNTMTTHAEVLAAAHDIVPKLTNVVRGVLRKL